MEDPEISAPADAAAALTQADLAIDTLGETTIHSPLGLNDVSDDGIGNYVSDARTVLFDSDRDRLLKRIRAGGDVPAFEMAGPRQKIFFDPARVKAAIVTCGGLCPGINNVIRTLVFELQYRYGVRTTFGIRYGYRGFIPKYGYEPLPLTP